MWNLPDAVNDPLFGLSPLPELDLPESPYRNLNWFTRKHAEVFFGRGHQIRELYERLASREYLFGFHKWRERHPGDSFEFQTPLQGLGIGQQMAWLRKQVRDESRQLLLFPRGNDS